MKIDKNLTKEEQEDLDLKLKSMDNPCDFENYCGACDNFGNPDTCPFFTKVNNLTEWRKIHCINFWD